MDAWFKYILSLIKTRHQKQLYLENVDLFCYPIKDPLPQLPSQITTTCIPLLNKRIILLWPQANVKSERLMGMVRKSIKAAHVMSAQDYTSPSLIREQRFTSVTPASAFFGKLKGPFG